MEGRPHSRNFASNNGPPNLNHIIERFNGMCVPYSTFTSHFLRIIGASGCYLSSSRLLPTTVTIDIILSDQRHRHFDIGVVYLLTCEDLLAELHTSYSYSVWRLRRGGCKETMGRSEEHTSELQSPHH